MITSLGIGSAQLAALKDLLKEAAAGAFQQGRQEGRRQALEVKSTRGFWQVPTTNGIIYPACCTATMFMTGVLVTSRHLKIACLASLNFVAVVAVDFFSAVFFAQGHRQVPPF